MDSERGRLDGLAASYGLWACTRQAPHTGAPGIPPVPFDKLFGTFHDGTSEAHARMRERAKARRGGAAA